MAQTLSKEFGDIRQKFAEQFRKKGNQNLANTIETSTSAKLTEQNFITALKTTFPEFSTELETLKEEIENLQEQGKEEYNPLKYFDHHNEPKNFQPNWLAEDIEEKYSFLRVEENDQLYVFQNGYYQPRGEELIKEECDKRLGDHVRRRRKKEVVETIKDRNNIKRKEFTPPKRKINLQNGVYDLDEEKLLDHSPEYFFKHKIPRKYRPEAECPNIHDFLESIVNSEEDVKTLREIAGYILLPDYPIAKIPLLVGQGSNGKSIYIDLLKELVGDENYTNKSLQDLEDQRFATHQLYGKLACFDDDLPSDRLSNTNMIKKLTGGTDVPAEIKYGGTYQFENKATLVYACNEVPKTTDQSDGFYRRWLIIDFPNKFTNEDDEHLDAEPRNKLMNRMTTDEELDGFLWWAVEGLKDVLNENEFTYAQTTEEVRDKWEEYSIPLVKFIERYVKQGVTASQANEKSDSSSSSGKVDDFHYDYIRKDTMQKIIAKFCQERSHSAPSKKEITQELKESDLLFGIKQTRREKEDRRVRVYSGLRLEIPEGVTGVTTFFEHRDTPAHACVCKDCSNQSVTLVTGGENDSLPSRIKDYLRNNGETNVQELANELEVSEFVIEQNIEDLESNGEIWESKPGVYDIV